MPRLPYTRLLNFVWFTATLWVIVLWARAWWCDLTPDTSPQLMQSAPVSAPAATSDLADTADPGAGTK